MKPGNRVNVTFHVTPGPRQVTREGVVVATRPGPTPPGGELLDVKVGADTSEPGARPVELVNVRPGPVPDGSGPYWSEIDPKAAAATARATTAAGKGRDDDDD